MNQKKKLIDLIQDASFLRWLRAGRPKTEREWHDWTENDPSNDELASDITEIESGIPFKKKKVTADIEAVNWNAIQSRIKREVPNKRRRLLAWSAAAAVALTLGTYWWQTQDSEWVTYQAKNGVIEEVALPDGSIVYLAPNAAIRYLADMHKVKERSVYLDGEAYFDVKQQSNKAAFKVINPRIEVLVLGTSFNVNARRQQAIVSLTRGSLQAWHPVSEVSKILEPGQTVQYDNSLQKFELLDDQSIYWSSWKDGTWNFGEAGVTMAEVILRIEETFGLKCIVRDASILEGRPAGKVVIENRDLLFESLGTLFDLEFIVDGNEVYIEQKTD